MQKILITGSSAGIGRAMSLQLLQQGRQVAGTGRNRDRLQETADLFPGRFFYRVHDLQRIDEVPGIMQALIDEMQGMDSCILSAAVSPDNLQGDWQTERAVLDVNISAVVRCALFALSYFEKQGFGRLAAFSSLALHFGSAQRPAYNASKAFVSRYVQGLQIRCKKKRIVVQEIRPGFVDTDMIKGVKSRFAITPVDSAAQRIIREMLKNKPLIYDAWWWSFMGKLLPLVPGQLMQIIRQYV